MVFFWNKNLNIEMEHLKIWLWWDKNEHVCFFIQNLKISFDSFFRSDFRMCFGLDVFLTMHSTSFFLLLFWVMFSYFPFSNYELGKNSFNFENFVQFVLFYTDWNFFLFVHCSEYEQNITSFQQANDKGIFISCKQLELSKGYCLAILIF